ncbi:hypothetical protein QC762_0074720 [Podospora pseudocomata]|uniref:Uncharacterized protein n=1 Tax=Podospora pseudocomata TaxID=2093779 RepID=A0ABR0GA38_9PEZI|nr:hypothetical protein QC762_0074720 [Podospora pseudocomata]
MAAIALGKAPALEVVERLDQAVQLRQAALRLLNGKPPITFNAESEPKGNALLGEFLLVQAQSAAEQGHISRSWQLLDQWTPAYVAQPSLLESIMSFRFYLMRGKSTAEASVYVT